jgi:signal transduction histidine kinase
MLQISKDYNKILLLGLVSSIFVSIFLFYQVSQKHKKERVFEAYSTEIRISRKVHDEIANELYGTILFVANEEVVSGAKKDKLISQLDDIYLRTRNISRENNDIDTGLLYSVQLKLMLSGYNSSTVNVLIKGIDKLDWTKVSVPKKIMVNMTKHSKATVVLVDFKEEKKKIAITYSDNGKGLDTDKIIFKNGLQNVENRMDSIDGSIIFDSRPKAGFHLTLTYPAHTPYV